MADVQTALLEALQDGYTVGELHQLITSARKELKEQGRLPKVRLNRGGFSEALTKRRIRTIGKRIKELKEQIQRAQSKITKWKAEIESLKAERGELKAQIKAHASK